MSLRYLACAALACLCLTALHGAEKKKWNTNCVSLFLAGQNAAARCAPGVEIFVPTAAEITQGQLPTLTFETRDPKFPILRFELNKASTAGAAIDLRISRLNDAAVPPGMNCRFLPNSMNRAAVSVTCTAGQAILAHVLSVDEPTAVQFFNQAVAMHDLLSPAAPFPRAAPTTTTTSTASPSVAVSRLEGQCRLLRFNNLDLTSTCQPPLTVQIPDAAATVAKGGQPRLMILSKDATLPVWIYLSDSQPRPDGTVAWTVTGVNSAKADPNSLCVVSRTEVLCRGTAGGSGGGFALSYSLTGSAAAIQQISALMPGAAVSSAAPAKPSVPTAKTVLSTDPKAIFGLLAGTPKPDLVRCLEDSNTGSFRIPPDAPLCRSEAGAAISEIFGALKQQHGDYEKMGLTVISVFVNDQVYDTRFADNVLLYVDAANVIQRIKVTTRLVPERDIMAMLTAKYGQPARQTSTTWTNPQTGAFVSQTPNYSWSFPNLLVDYLTRDATVLNKLSTAGGIDVYTPAYVRLVEADQKRRGLPPPRKKGM